MSEPFNVYYDNLTGRIIIKKKNNSPPRSRSPPKDFDKKIEELYNFTKLDSPNKVSLERPSVIRETKSDIDNINTININRILDEPNKRDFKEKEQINNNNDTYAEYINKLNKESVKKIENNEKYPVKKIENNIENNEKYPPYLNKLNKSPEINNKFNNNSKLDFKNEIKNETINDSKIGIINDSKNNSKLNSKSLIYGIKKTILSDFNHLYQSSNNNDFKIGLNKNISSNTKIFDCFYLFPNISEINTKNETNIINEKKIEIFYNKNNLSDIQYFPIDFIACGSNIPLLSENKYFTKLRIKNIFWNIFQSINSENYQANEILSVIPNKDEFIYKNINLQVNFELHSQIINKDLPYKMIDLKNITPANTCLYEVPYFQIFNLNGSNFHFLEIDLDPKLKLECALLCVKISVPCNSIKMLEGVDKNGSTSYGHIPFSQFILNFDYEMF
jgi:hypothetical protein